MEEHLGGEESLIADVDLELLARDARLVQVLLEFVVEVPVAVRSLLLLVKLGILSGHILAHIAVLLLGNAGDFRSILTGDRLLAISLHLQNVLCDVATGKRDVLNAATNDEASRNGEHVSDTVTGVNDETGEIIRIQIMEATLAAANLTVERESRLHTNIKSLDAECLEHDLRHLLTVLGCVEWRLCEDKPVILRLASQILIDRLVPEAFNTLPVLNLTTAQHITQVVGLLVRECIIADMIVEITELELGVFLKQRDDN